MAEVGVVATETETEIGTEIAMAEEMTVVEAAETTGDPLAEMMIDEASRAITDERSDWRNPTLIYQN